MAEWATTFPVLFAAAWDGEPPVPDTEPGLCELCGHDGERMRWKPRSTWGAFDTHAVPGEGAICLGCHLLTVGRSPIVSRSGSRTLAWTLFTLATDGDSWRALTAAQKPGIAAVLADPAWAVSATTTGKRSVAHLTPGARPGMRSCAIDGEPVVMPLATWQALSTLVQDAYQEGATKRALDAAAMEHGDVRRLGVERAREIEAALRPHRATAALRLAVWVAYKEEQ